VRTVELRLRAGFAAGALDLPGRARQHGRRQEDVDRGVGHSLLEELHVDDRLAVVHDRAFHGEREIVHQRRHEIGLLLERRMHLGE
jgi:hypothetical protein